MHTFIVWIGVLCADYEHIISRELLQLGYHIGPANNMGQMPINVDNLLAYNISHPSKHTIEDVDCDVRNIIQSNKLMVHSRCVITIINGQMRATWGGSNIDFSKHLPNSGDNSDTAPVEPNKPPPVLPSAEEAKAIAAAQEIEDVVTHMHRILDDYKTSGLHKMDSHRTPEECYSH